MGNNKNLKYSFLILLPAFLLLIIIFTNWNRPSNLVTDNTLIPTTTSALEGDPYIGDQIVAQLVSYNDTTKELVTYMYTISYIECSRDDTCFTEESKNNKRKFTVSDKFVFYINKKSLTTCVRGELNYESAVVLIDEFKEVSCNYIGSEQLFLVDLEAPESITFTEYNL